MWLIKKKRKNCKEQCLGLGTKGFTLIEVLVATSILGTIGLTILTTFGSGLHVFERVQLFGGAQADTLLAFEEMEKDIKNIFPLSTINFEGSTQSIIFPAVVEIFETIDGEESLVSSIGRISYYMNDAVYLSGSEKGLIRTQQNYSQAIAKVEFEENQGDYLTPLEDLTFEYYYYDEEEEVYGWQSSWGDEEENLLSGIKIAMTYKDGDQDVEIERTVIIPALQKIIEIEEEEEEGEEGGEGE